MLATPLYVEPVPELNALISPVNMELIATPTRISLIGLNPDFHERRYTNAQAVHPPTQANNGVNLYKSGKQAVTSTATKLAPELTPMIPGSASGFFITACKSTPDTAIAAPPSIAINILGKRRS